MSLYTRDRKRYDHERYMAHREERIAAMLDYNENYRKKGLHKPRKKPQKSRSQKQHEYYLENRERILARQARYREEHKEELRQRRRDRFRRLWIEHFDNKNYAGRNEQPAAGTIARAAV